MQGTRWRIGVDVGGTFTDFSFVAVPAAGGARAPGPPGVTRHFKVASTPSDPAQAILAGLRSLAERHGVEPTAVEALGHGTTVATNALVERRGARTGLLATAGFRDVVEIGRQTRPHLYDYRKRRAPPLVPRRWRIEIQERLDGEGKEITPLADGQVAEAGRRFLEAGVEAIAICFLHAYRNPEHEREAARILAGVLPADVPVSLSSSVWPEYREFERAATTCANAFLAPRMGRYLESLGTGLQRAGIEVEPRTFHSNGGLMTPCEVAEFPIRTCLSGPAAGVIGAAAIAHACGLEDVVTFDVGGTSTDVALIARGRPAFALEREIGGTVLKSPCVDVHVIGAGGGSIAEIDRGGALRVGPESAGADPGPCAYGKGGERPTLTDAHVVLGRLNPVALLGGELPLDARAAQAALARLGASMHRGAAEAAAGVVEVAVASVARAIRTVSVERGIDLDRFILMAYGGAGPLLAAEVAREVRVPRVLIPSAPGTLCARGVLTADPSVDYVRTCACPANEEGWVRVEAAFEAMRREARAWFEAEGAAPDRCSLRAVLDARYVGQGFELPFHVPFFDGDRVDDRDEPGARLERARSLFHQAHRVRYGYALPERAVELVNARLEARVRSGLAVAPGRSGEAEQREARPRRRTRPVYFWPPDGGGAWVGTPILPRSALGPGDRLVGPVVVEELSATTVARPGDRLEVDRFGNLWLEVSGNTGTGSGGDRVGNEV